MNDRFPCPLSYCLLWLVVLIMMLSAQPSPAQTQQRVDTNQFINHFPLPDTAVPWRSTWGFNNDEFSIGAYYSIEPGPGDSTSIWNLARDLGISIMEVRPYSDNDVVRVDSLIDSARGRTEDGRWHERIITTAGLTSLLGQSRDVILYPFDSSQGYYDPCFFRIRRFGDTASNPDPHMIDHLGHRMKEVIYDRANTPGDTIVAERMAFKFDTTRQKQRYPDPGDIYQNHELSGDEFTWRNDLDLSYMLGAGTDHRTARWLYIVVTAHLFDASHGGRQIDEGLGDTLLIVELHNERCINQKYVSGWADASHKTPTITTADANHSELYKRIYITRQQLLPETNKGALNYNTYRRVIDSIDMIVDSATGVGGPWHPYSAEQGHVPTNQRFDIRIRWTGKEKLALHSVALRDTMAHLLFTSDSLFRLSMLQKTDRLMHGTTSLHSKDWDKRRDSVLIRFYTGDEPTSVRFAGFNWFDSTLYRRYGGGDSMTRGPRAWHGRNHLDIQNILLSSDNEICVETYPKHFIASYERTSFGFPSDFYTKPAIREHNGGRFDNGPGTESMLPELVIDTTSRQASRNGIELYTRFVQLMQLGTTMPEATMWPWFYIGRQGSLLANAAWASRRTGRRLIHWPGLFGGLEIKWNAASKRVDTLVRCILEPAEMRAAVNIGLCYGARGVHYPIIGGNRLVHGTNTPAGLSAGTDWGPHGALTTDTADVVTLMIRHWDTSNHTYTAVIPKMYTGWGVNSAELRWLNKEWLPKMGTELLKLRWREGYSIHFTAPQPFMPDTDVQPRSRPVPSTEIITNVAAFDIYGTRDRVDLTFVELGLFDVKKGKSGNRQLDTNYVFVVNRRTFERSTDLNDTLPDGQLTSRMKMMDSLTETRRIRLQLNLRRVDTTAYNFFRIRERTPDTTPLAHALHTPRQPLDTVVLGDSAITFLLGPGRAALLEIRNLGPATELPEDLRRQFRLNDISPEDRRKGSFLPADPTQDIRAAFPNSEDISLISLQNGYNLSYLPRFILYGTNPPYPTLILPSSVAVTKIF